MIARYFIQRPHFAAVVAILTVLCGAVCIRFFPISQYPDITPVQIFVAASYPGADAQVIQESIAAPIEDRVNNIPGIIYLQSQSGNDGTYSLSVYFELGTDADIAEVQVQNRIALASAELPAAVLQQGVQVTKQSGDMIMVISLFSPQGTRDELFLSNYAANFLHDELQRIPGVANVAQFGQLEYSMRIWINPVRMAALNVTAGEIADAIRNQNVAAAAGQVGAPPFGTESVDFQFKLRAEGLLHQVSEFERIVVATGEDGSLIRIADVARVELGSATYSGSAQLNGEAAALVAIYQQSDANALDISEAVHARLAELAGRFPSGVEYTVSYDVAKPVRGSIYDILVTLLFTAILVIGVTYLFLGGWRPTLVPAIAIPVSLLGAIALIYAIGFSANMITLFALLLAITLVVDDAIIIVENAERILSERDIDVEAATLEAMEQVNRPIVSTTFVLAAVFVPVCFFPGLTGIIYFQFAATIIFAFVLSAVNALTLGPVLCAMMLKQGYKPRGLFTLVARAIAWIRAYYLKAVALLVRSTTATVTILLVSLATTIYLFSTAPTGLIPQEDNGVLLVSSQLPAGASLQRTSALMSKLGEITKQSSGVDSVITVAGTSLLAGGGSNQGMAVITLVPREERDSSELTWRAIMQSLNEQFAALPEAQSYVFPIPSIPGLGSAGGVSAELLDLEGGDASQLESVMSAFITALNAAPEFSSANGNYSGKTPQFLLSLDRDRAQTLGIEIADIFTELQANLSS
ncbi:MAG: efflux RND transporter permease subunit, partial [Pseudomonadota bacterium]